MNTSMQSASHSVKTGFQFLPPANVQDFAEDPASQAALETQWNENLNGFTRQGINGNPWNALYAAGITNYIDPAVTPIPDNAQVQPVQWNAFPGRISYYFPSLSQQEIYSLADTGYQTNGQSFPDITIDPCTSETVKPLAYGPYGPRGWQDEYCEWAVTRNAKGQITKIDFTCENPEYWNTLWMINPDKVLELYQKTLNKPQISLEDLYLYDSGQVIYDQSTNRPAYNPLNKWNCGPSSTDTAGGAMHLTSTPNTLQTEIGLASAATSQHTCGNNDFNTLICCAQYGQPHRNSDPNIGGSVNKLAGLGLALTLTNPPGLYIQNPDFSGYTTPDGTDASTFWTIARGEKSLTVNGASLPGNFILHAVFEVPESYGYTVSDININGDAIQWAGQVTQTFLMQIVATAFQSQAPAVQQCVANTAPDSTYAQPLQLFYQEIFAAMANAPVENPVQARITLISNSTLIAPLAEQGANNLQMVLTTATVQANPNDPGTWPSVNFDSDDISAEVTAVGTVNYAVPGNSYPANTTALYITVNVGDNAGLGLQGVYVTNQGQQQQAVMPALLNVVAKS